MIAPFARLAPSVPRRTIRLYAVAAAALLLVLGYWQMRQAAPLPDAGHSTVPALPRESAERAVAAERAHPAPVAARVSSAAAALRRQFETSPDLAALARQLASPRYDGDAEARWILSRIYDYCAAYAWDPAGYARDTQAIAGLRLAAGDALRGARERVASRCAGFTPDDGLAQEKILDQREQAAEAGSLPAQAALLSAGRPLQTDAAYLRWLIQQVLASRDPEAFVAISPAMGLRASGQEAYHGRVSGTPLTELAWLIAACRLGQDCGPRSVLVTRHCANGGICSRDPSQDFETFARDAGVTRQDEPALDEMVTTLMNGTELK